MGGQEVTRPWAGYCESQQVIGCGGRQQKSMKVIHWGLGASRGTSELKVDGLDTHATYRYCSKRTSLGSHLWSYTGRRCSLWPADKVEKEPRMDHRWLSSVVAMSPKRTADTLWPLSRVALKGKETSNGLSIILCQTEERVNADSWAVVNGWLICQGPGRSKIGRGRTRKFREEVCG